MRVGFCNAHTAILTAAASSCRRKGSGRVMSNIAYCRLLFKKIMQAGEPGGTGLALLFRCKKCTQALTFHANTLAPMLMYRCSCSPCVSELHCDGLCHRFNFSHHLLAGGPRAVDHIRPDSYKLHLSTRASPKDSHSTARWNHLASHPGCILSAWTCSLCFCFRSFRAE